MKKKMTEKNITKEDEIAKKNKKNKMA